MEPSKSLSLRIRKHALEMTSLGGGSSHIGSILSMVDILAVLYGSVLNVDPQQPKWPNRDRFILSKGHAGAGVYAALAERGFFSPDKLKTHYQDGSDLSGHVSHKGIPGVELSTGSLGHGLSVGTGMALSAKKRASRHRVFVVMSDGECDEGSIWEAAMFAGFHQLHQLFVVIDYNKYQSLTTTTETLDLEPFADKWSAFRWEVREVDGHDHRQLSDAFRPSTTGQPVIVIAHTIKGKGVSFMENQVLWHYRTAKGEEFNAAMAELNAQQ
ncbi:transketolase [bacterium]|nr:transketolase [bacterium]